MKFFQNSSLLSFLTVSLFITMLTGCGSDHDHGPTPVGLVLSVGGTEIAMQEETTVTYASGDHIEVTQGTTLGPILVEFISEGGERYLPDTNEGFSLQYSSSNSNVVSLAQVTGANEWTVQLVGNVAGESASITFELWHVDHSDFVSRPFQVRVVEPQLQD
jgi:hypothetical protein